MFDIHTHILPNIDDGSASLETSIKMLQDAIDQGVSDLILTPHFDIYGLKCDVNTDYQKEFNNFQEEVIKRNLKINLYLGNEIYYTKGIYKYLKSKKIFPLGNTNKVLIELDFNNYNVNFEELIYEFKIEGYQVIIAHAERYSYSNYKLIREWKEKGALIQVNASSFYGSRKIKNIANKLLKENLVDYIASDVHSFRKNCIKQFIKDYKETSYFDFK